MSNVSFYSVKHRRAVDVPENEITKVIYNAGGGPRERYGLRAETTVDGEKVKLTKFINKATYDGTNVPVAQ